MGKPQEMCYWLHDAFGLVSFSAAVYFSVLGELLMLSIWVLSCIQWVGQCLHHLEGSQKCSVCVCLIKNESFSISHPCGERIGVQETNFH